MMKRVFLAAMLDDRRARGRANGFWWSAPLTDEELKTMPDAISVILKPPPWVERDLTTLEKL